MGTTALKYRIKTALDESRMLILGSQVLIGFQYRTVFEQGFEKLPVSSQMLRLGSLVIMLLVSALLMSPGPYHRIVHEGEDREDVHIYATRVMDIALMPFAIILSLEVYLAAGYVTGKRLAIVIGSITFGVALLFWYGVALLRKGRASKKGRREVNDRTEIEDKIERVLTEARVVLPGVQALLGFQFATVLVQSFEALPLSSKYVHLVSLCLMALSMILLMSPAAFHRIVEKGENTERMVRFAGGMLLAAMVPLPLGISGDFFVVVRKVTSAPRLAIIASTAVLVCFYALWFGYTSYRRRELNRRPAR